MRRDPEALATAVALLPEAADPAETLAATRLDAGLHPDSSEAHLRHALAVLDHGSRTEAEQAIHRCADSLPSWERPAMHRQLTAAANARPDLDIARIIQAFDNALNQRNQPA